MPPSSNKRLTPPDGSIQQAREDQKPQHKSGHAQSHNFKIAKLTEGNAHNETLQPADYETNKSERQSWHKKPCSAEVTKLNEH